MKARGELKNPRFGDSFLIAEPLFDGEIRAVPGVCFRGVRGV